MNKFLLNHSEKLTGYLLILPAVLIISLFGIFPVFFGMYMSVHKWKVFKGRFLGFENYQRILGGDPFQRGSRLGFQPDDRELDLDRIARGPLASTHIYIYIVKYLPA